jgi:transglutaminase-like putative cysteine protease
MNSRRDFLRRSSAFPLAAAIPSFVLSGAASAADSPAQRSFDPRPQDGWRTFEVTTRVDIDPAHGATQVWLPLPSIESGWQRSLESSFSSNGAARMVQDGKYGARILHARFTAEERPFVELTSRVQTRDRALDWSQSRIAKAEDAATLAFWTQPTDLIPTGGIVRSTALEATRGARDDVAKARAIYEWVVHNTYRETTVRGCGEGDIKTLLEGGKLGGKCADLNALFVGMCRSVGIPARDLYGVRLAPSKFGYRELGGNPAKLSGAQHCRAEAYLRGYGWVAMDPADVTKVMRQETAEWIKTTTNAVVAPVHKGLFGCCEGNWLAYSAAHDVALPSSSGPRLGFLMYPVAENAKGRFDSYTPDDFKYRITAREITA